MSSIWNRVLCDMEYVGSRKEGHEILHAWAHEEHDMWFLYVLRGNSLVQISEHISIEDVRAAARASGYVREA